MSSPSCHGPYHESDGAGWFCPLDPNLDPPEGVSWETYCTACRERAEWWRELGCECVRAEA